MTSHSNIPKAFASIEEYNKFFLHVNKQTEKQKLLHDAKIACAWGLPDNESIGYSQVELISLIRILAFYIEKGNE